MQWKAWYKETCTLAPYCILAAYRHSWRPHSCFTVNFKTCTTILETSDDLQTCLDAKKTQPILILKMPGVTALIRNSHQNKRPIEKQTLHWTICRESTVQVFPYRCGGVLWLQRCCWRGNRCSRALLWQGLLLLLCRRSNWNWRLDLWGQLCLWRRWSLPLRGVYSLGLWSRWHCLRSRRGGSIGCCCCLLLLRAQAWGCVVRCWGSTRYWRRRITVHGRLWKRWAVNVAPLRTRSHCRRIHRTGSAGHLCLRDNKETFATAWRRKVTEITLKRLLSYSYRHTFRSVTKSLVFKKLLFQKEKWSIHFVLLHVSKMLFII